MQRSRKIHREILAGPIGWAITAYGTYIGSAGYYGYGVLIAVEWIKWWGRTGGGSFLLPTGRHYLLWKRWG